MYDGWLSLSCSYNADAASMSRSSCREHQGLEPTDGRRREMRKSKGRRRERGRRGGESEDADLAGAGAVVGDGHAQATVPLGVLRVMARYGGTTHHSGVELAAAALERAAERCKGVVELAQLEVQAANVVVHLRRHV